MIADSDVQVWLDTVARTQPPVVVPYVVSDSPRSVRYRIRAIRTGSAGRSIIGQTGALVLSADVPAALSTLSMSGAPGENCQIEVLITSGGMQERRFVFECPS